MCDVFCNLEVNEILKTYLVGFPRVTRFMNDWPGSREARSVQKPTSCCRQDVVDQNDVAVVDQMIIFNCHEIASNPTTQPSQDCFRKHSKGEQ